MTTKSKTTSRSSCETVIVEGGIIYYDKITFNLCENSSLDRPDIQQNFLKLYFMHSCYPTARITIKIVCDRGTRETVPTKVELVNKILERLLADGSDGYEPMIKTLRVVGVYFDCDVSRRVEHVDATKTTEISDEPSRCFMTLIERFSNLENLEIADCNVEQVASR